MNQANGNFTDWKSIDYRPAIAEILPSALLLHISRGQSALDIGCNKGAASIFLAKNGLNVVGIDINSDALDIAGKRAETEGVGSAVRFAQSDIIASRDIGTFDLVVMIRLLTCIPVLENWNMALRQAYSALKHNGIIYINDFMIATETKNYRERYKAGQKFGWRPYNFAVNDKNGKLLFIAHHHPEDELNDIIRPYSKMSLHFQKSRSMNGNECNMFEFMGRKK